MTTTLLAFGGIPAIACSMLDVSKEPIEFLGCRPGPVISPYPDRN